MKEPTAFLLLFLLYKFIVLKAVNSYTASRKIEVVCKTVFKIDDILKAVYGGQLFMA